jgi:6-phospho-beta-glucosidase
LQRLFAGLLGIEPERLLVDQVGLNHMTWVRALRLDGRDILPELLAEHGDAIAEEIELPRRLLDELGAVPSYYLRYFYAHDAVLDEQLRGVTRATTVAEIERELLELYRNPSLAERPALLDKRGGKYYSEAAVGVVRSLATDAGEVHVVDVRNGETLAGLAEDDVVEVPARIDSGGATPLPQPPFAPELLGLVQHTSSYERLAAEAALSDDPALVRKALLAHPLVGQWAMTEELFERMFAGVLEAAR